MRSGIRRLFERVETKLDDEALGFLALLSLFLIFVPAVFALSPSGQQIVSALEIAIISTFAVEYLSAFALAPSKRDFVMNSWRLIDALIILAPVAALLPAVPEVFRNSPALRLMRLGRVALLGTRSGFALTAPTETNEAAVQSPATEPSVRALGTSGEAFEEIGWQTALERIRSAEPAWLFVSGVGEEQLPPIADALNVPIKPLESLFSSSVPRFDRLERFSALFVRHPLPMLPEERMRRTPVLLIGSAQNVVVLIRDRSDLEARVEARLPSLPSRLPHLTRATVALLGEIVRAYSDVVEILEAALVRVETEQARLRDEAFLGRTFALRGDILRVRGSLRHLRSEVRDESFRDGLLAGSSASDMNLINLLAQNIEDLYESVEDLRESLQALVDLRLNVSSFQMNRVMRLLALLTALALIPATAGGLLGMNLQDTPWPATLAQVSFGLAAGMALSLYVFAIKGWLR